MRRKKIDLPENVTLCRKAHQGSIPTRFHKPYVGSATSLKKATVAKCQDCMGYEDVAVRIRECECFICPLWPHRPYQTAPPVSKNCPLGDKSGTLPVRKKEGE